MTLLLGEHTHTLYLCVFCEPVNHETAVLLPSLFFNIPDMSLSKSFLSYYTQTHHAHAFFECRGYGNSCIDAWCPIDAVTMANQRGKKAFSLKLNLVIIHLSPSGDFECFCNFIVMLCTFALRIERYMFWIYKDNPPVGTLPQWCGFIMDWYHIIAALNLAVPLVGILWTALVRYRCCS